MSLLLLLLCSSSPDLAKKTIIIQKSNGIYFMSEYASEFGYIREFVGEFASFLWHILKWVLEDTGRVSWFIRLWVHKSEFRVSLLVGKCVASPHWLANSLFFVAV